MEQPPTIRALGRNSAWQNIGSCHTLRPAWALEVVGQSLDPDKIPNNTLEAPNQMLKRKVRVLYLPEGWCRFPRCHTALLFLFMRLRVCVCLVLICLFICSLACLGRRAWLCNRGETKLCVCVCVGHCLVFFRFTHMVITDLGGGRSSRYFRT